MRRIENSLEALTFCDGDDVLLSHLNNGKRQWANGHEAFSHVQFHDEHIEFRQLTEDGVDLADTGTAETTFQWTYFRSLGDIAYTRAVLFDGEDDDWLWHSVAVPMPDVLDDFREQSLVGLGANSYPLSLREGDGADGEFRLPTIMDTLIDKKLPIGNNPGYFVHDMYDHSVGMAAIDRSSMNALRSLAFFSQQLAANHPFHSRDLADSIAVNLDYYSFYRNFSNKMSVGLVDPLLTDILQSSLGFEPKHVKHMKSIFKGNGFSVPGDYVIRNADMIHYYDGVIKLLEPKVEKAD